MEDGGPAKEFCTYLAIAVGSANEMEVHLKTSHELELEYITAEEFERLRAEYEIVGKQLTRLIQYWSKRDQSPVTNH